MDGGDRWQRLESLGVRSPALSMRVLAYFFFLDEAIRSTLKKARILYYSGLNCACVVGKYVLAGTFCRLQYMNVK